MNVEPGWVAFSDSSVELCRRLVALHGCGDILGLIETFHELRFHTAVCVTPELENSYCLPVQVDIEDTDEMQLPQLRQARFSVGQRWVRKVPRLAADCRARNTMCVNGYCEPRVPLHSCCSDSRAASLCRLLIVDLRVLGLGQQLWRLLSAAATSVALKISLLAVSVIRCRDTDVLRRILYMAGAGSMIISPFARLQREASQEEKEKAWRAWRSAK